MWAGEGLWVVEKAWDREPTKSAQVENQASTVSPEPPGRLPQWTSPTGGTFQRGAGAAGFAIIPCKPREPSDTLSRI